MVQLEEISINNINEERFYNTASKANKNKIDIEHRKNIPTNTKKLLRKKI